MRPNTNLSGFPSLFIFVSLFLWTITPVSAQQIFRTETFSVNDDVNVQVRTSGGNVDLQGNNGDEVRVEMFVRDGRRYLRAGDDDLSEFNITIERNGNTVLAIAERKKGFRSNWNGKSISFKVYAPTRVSSELRTSGGNITLGNVQGNQSVRTSGGNLEATQVIGNIEMRTSGGNIELKDVSGSADVRTSGGSIRAAMVTNGISARTSGGNIRLEDISGNTMARTSGGTVSVSIPEPGDLIELRTSGGNISIEVPGDRGYVVDLRGNRVKGEFNNFSGKLEKDDVEGTINGGGTTLSARTSGGTVALIFN